jgi:hypothetical protein
MSPARLKEAQSLCYSRLLDGGGGDPSPTTLRTVWLGHYGEHGMPRGQQAL